jgi:hypothetical protein
MKCLDVTYLLVELADGTITPEDRTAVEHHLSACASCASDAELLQHTFAALRNVPEEPPPAHYFNNLLPRIRTRLEKGNRPWQIAVPVWLNKVLAPLAVTGMAVVMVGLFHLFQPTDDFMPLRNILGQVPADDIVNIVSAENEPFESNFGINSSTKILDAAPNPNLVADRMRADLLAGELPYQQTDLNIVNDESSLDGLDEDAVSQVLTRMNDSSAL